MKKRKITTNKKGFGFMIYGKKRKTESEFATLYGELVDHVTKLFEYF